MRLLRRIINKRQTRNLQYIKLRTKTDNPHTVKLVGIRVLKKK